MFDTDAANDGKNAMLLQDLAEMGAQPRRGLLVFSGEKYMRMPPARPATLSKRVIDALLCGVRSHL
jgi:hypothetical protein